VSGIDEYGMWLERAVTGKNVEELEKAYEGLLRSIKRIDPITLAEATDGRYRSDGVPRIQIQFLHSWFVLDLLPYRIRAGHLEIDTLPLKVLTLHHMIAAADNQGTAVRVMGRWIDCRSLQDGAFLGTHFSRSVSDALDGVFALNREDRLSRVLAWGGRPLELGDEGYLFNFFPRLPVALINWAGDKEFPPSAKILFDVSASNYMPTHGLIALTEFLIFRLAGRT
jgi:hypothetical protein